MSEYTFKNLNEIDNVTEPADGTTVMGFENGTPIQMPMSAVKGSAFVINPDDPDYSETDTAYGDKIKEAILSGKTIYFYDYAKYPTTTEPHEMNTYWLVNYIGIKKLLDGSKASLDLGYYNYNDPVWHTFTITVY